MPSERRRMLFVGGVPPQITEERLQAHFKKYGRVHKVKIVVDKKTRESKGYAYITVADARVMPSILKATHVILDRKLDVQLATSKGDKKKWQEDARQKRVFVSSLPNWATAKDLETAFAKFGPIHNAYIIYDYQKATYKDYGYVQFDSSADAAVAVKSQISVLGKEVTCQPYLNKTQQLEVAQNAKAGQHQPQGCSGEQPKSCSDSGDGSDEEMLPQQSLPPLEIKNEDPRSPHTNKLNNSQMWQVPYTPYRETPCVVGQSSHHFDESIEPFEPRSFSNQHCGVDLQGQVATEASLAASPVYQHESSSSIRGRSKQSTFSLFGTQPAAVKRNSLLTRKKTVGSAKGSNTNLNCRPT